MEKDKKIGIGVALGIFGFFILASVVSTMSVQEEEQKLRNLSIQELSELSVSWNYDDILRNPEKYEEKIIHLNGKIFVVTPKGGDNYVLTTWVNGADTIFIEYTGSRVLSGDTISVYGEFEKIVNVESMLIEGFVNPYPYVKAIRLTCTSC